MSGFVYAIEAPDGLVKIGFTTDLKRRFSKLQSDNFQRLRPCGYVEATCAQEAELHGLLEGSREHGEWFRPSARVRALVGLLQPWERERPLPPSAHPLHRWRSGRGLSLNALAEITGIDKGCLSRYERGRSIPRKRRLQKILEATSGAITLRDFYLYRADHAE